MEDRTKLAMRLIDELLNCLPDADSQKSDCWERCWDELDDEAQSSVKSIRMKASDFLKELRAGDRD